MYVLVYISHVQACRPLKYISTAEQVNGRRAGDIASSVMINLKFHYNRSYLHTSFVFIAIEAIFFFLKILNGENALCKPCA